MKNEIILNKIRKIQDKINEGKKIEAINDIKSFTDSEGFLIPLLIKRLHLIQTLDEDFEEFGTLNDIRKAYEEILLLDENSLYVLIEYSHFLFAVMDDPNNALSYIKKAKNLCNKYIAECDDLIKDCESEL